MNIEQIVISNEMSLTREVFRFYVNDEMKLRLSTYYFEKRETTRHKFKIDKCFHHTDQRGNTINREAIYIPSVVIERVKQQIFEKIDFIK
jgi:hypothetical protein